MAPSGGAFYNNSIHQRRMESSSTYQERLPTRHHQSSTGGWSVSPSQYQRGRCGWCSVLAWSFTAYSAITGCAVMLINVANPDMQWRVIQGHALVAVKAVAQHNWAQASSGARDVADTFVSGVGQAEWARLGNATAVRRALPSWTGRLPLEDGLHWLDKGLQDGVDAMKAHKAALAPELEPLVGTAVKGLSTPLSRFALFAALLAYLVLLPVLHHNVCRKGRLEKAWDMLRDSVLVVLLVVFSVLVVQWIITMAKKMDQGDPDFAATSSSGTVGSSSEEGSAGIEDVHEDVGSGGGEEALQREEAHDEEAQVAVAVGTGDLSDLFG